MAQDMALTVTKPPIRGWIAALERIMSFNINALIEKHTTFHPRPSVLPHNTRAALMGPDDHRHSGGQAAYGSSGFGYPGRAESLSHVPPGLRASERTPHAPARTKSRDRACGEPHPTTG